jgi:DNA/RNA endonuclease G (NUC1)
LQSVSGDGERVNSDFKEDKGLDAALRSRLADFKGSGYDKGHLAPAANHKGSQAAMDDTFVLSNISPQVRLPL